MTTPDIVNIASFLPIMAKKQPHDPAIILPKGRDRGGRAIYTHYTFEQLERQSNCIARGLEEVGIGRGVRAALMVGPGLEFFALTFAIFKTGAVPVVIDPGIGIKNLKKCLAQAEPEAFIGIPKAHVARILFGWGKETIRTNVTVGRRLFWGGLTLEQVKKKGQSDKPYEMARTKGNEMAAILFTSGSTGTPRGVIYTHTNFAAQVEMIRKTYNIVPGEIDLATFPLFALFDPALGMTTVVPDMDPTRPAHVDPVKIIEAIKDFDITNMFGSPALINRVGRCGSKRGTKLPTLRRVIAAGGPMPPAVLERFCTMLSPDTQVFTGFGATESMPVCSIGSHEILGETRHGTDEGRGVCVGRPVEDVTVSVIGITDTPTPKWDDALKLPTGEIGEITVKGPIVTSAYYKKEEATRLAKIYDPDGKEMWHRMGDLGFLDEKGRLWFCGRKSHRVITPDGTFYTIPCEGVFNTHPDVYRTALVGVNMDGNIRLVLCVELEDDSKNVDKEKVKRELLELGVTKPHTKDIRTILFHNAFPVDVRHNAKISRDKLAVWAEKKLTYGEIMPRNPNNLSTDLRGVGSLTIDAISGITDIVESLHHTITSFSGVLGARDQYRTKGITGMVYRNIHTVTELVGDGIDALLDRLSSMLGEKDTSPGREAVVSALNGVLGDHLVARNNPLAIPMQFRRNGKPLREQALSEAIQQSNGRLAIMVHGSCMNDLQWNRQEHDHGAALARDLGFVPVYVHYNTGLHISENGRQFSDLLETVIDQSPQPIEFFIIAHSMGGLVSRSACHYGKTSGHAWPNHLRKLVFLGTPHHGSLLEKGGNWIDILLKISPYSVPFARLGKIRSCGITDMRYGNIVDDDWKGRDRFEHSGDQRIPMPLPEDVQCYSIAATTGKESNTLGDNLIGDGLVTLSSALGRHKNAELNLLFPKTHQWVGRNMKHMDLLNHPEVYETIKQWLRT